MGTYLANRSLIGNDIIPLYRDHPALHNVYSAIVVDSRRVPGAHEAITTRFLEYLISDDAQALIREFGDKKFHAPLFFPIAQFDDGVKARRSAAALAQNKVVIERLVALSTALVLAAIAAIALAVRFHRTERARRSSEERFMLAVSGTRDGIWDWNIGSGETFYSNRWKEILGYRAYDDEFENTIRTWQDRIHIEDREQVLARLDKYLAGRSDYFSAEHRISSKSGDYLWVHVRGKALCDAAGKPVRMAGSMSDITERKQQEQILAHQALHDSLTGLANRALLYERLRQVIATARHEGRTFAVLMLDLDNFKDINDTLGHPCGDLVLQQVARRLLHERPDTDTVARFGADKYTLILPEAETERAKQVVRDIAKAMERPFEVDGHSILIKASIGIAIYPEHGSDEIALIQRAEVALFRAKRQNSGYAIYDLDLDQHSHRYVAFASELQRATERNELLLHYQPMINLHTGYYSGMEALVRWRHPTQGLIGPDAFIPRAEDMGLIKIPTLWVLERALESCAAWQSANKRLSVAVNLSASYLHDPQLPVQIAGLLAQTGVAPSSLELEITESAIMTDPARAKEILRRLRAMGIKLVIDDFGTGYSSLSYLKELPVHKIKIDKAFVLDMNADGGDAAIIRATILLAHDLGLEVIAEGVEDEETLKVLAVLGCDTAQGYHVRRPLTEDSLLSWLEQVAADIEDVHQETQEQSDV